MKSVVEKYKLMKYIRLKHELVSADWDEGTSQWRLRIRRKMDDKDEILEDTADVLFLGVGSLNRWKWPDIEGIKQFSGRVIHSAQWEAEDGGWHESVKDWKSKRVGVIGNVRPLFIQCIFAYRKDKRALQESKLSLRFNLGSSKLSILPEIRLG
jgi:cation diffusion facilitator CzcD-associated flavoprotein CzcO